MVKGRQCSVYVDLATQAFPCIKFWILQEHLRDIRDDPEVLDPPKHIALALACTRTDIYTIYSMQVI